MRLNLELLKKPIPFEKGNMTLWDDEYIALNVIKRHLQSDIDSGSRRVSTIINTIKWIDDKTPLKGNLLDVGCGPGLYAKALADCGFYYHGIDISTYQIEYAQKHFHGDDIKFEVMDFRGLELNTRLYQTVLMLYGIYSFYKSDERIMFLKKIKSILAPDGNVFVEVFTENHYKNREESSDWEYIKQNGFWAKEPYLELNSFYRYTNLVLIQAARVNDEVRVWNSWIQTFTKETLKAEFEMAGFTEFEFYSSCTGKHYHDSTDVLCMVAK